MKKMSRPEYTNEFMCSTPRQAAKMLFERGVAVLGNVLTTAEAATFEAGIWQLVGDLTARLDVPVTKDNPASWRSWYKTTPSHGMLQQHYGVGQAQALWDVRQHPAVVGAFTDVYNVRTCKMHGLELLPTDMLASFDAFSFSPPPEVTGRGWQHPTKTWLHVDQGTKSHDFRCIQGFVNLIPVEHEGDATLEVLDGSHIHHRGLFNGIECKKDWYMLRPNQIEDLEREGCTKKRILAGAGDLVLWDSRLVHCGGQPLKGRKNPTTRAVVYTTFEPRQAAASWELTKKIACIDVPDGQELRTTSHDPVASRLFAKRPRTYGKEDVFDIVPITKKPVLTSLGRRLAGYNDDDDTPAQ